jgi:hypothetical protein
MSACRSFDRSGTFRVGVDVINPVRRLLKPKSLTIVGSQSPEHNWKRQLEIGFGDFEHPAAFLFAFSATFEIYRGLSDLSAPNSARGSGQLDRHNGRRAHLRSPRRKNGPNRTEKQRERQGGMTPQTAAEGAFKRVEEIFAKYPIA